MFASHVVLAAASRASREPGIHSIWEWIEENSLVVYPAIIVTIVLLIGGAIIASWHSQEISATQKGELKMKIMSIMRRRISGVSAEIVAAELQIDLMLAAKLLSELAEEGLVASSTGGAVSEATRYRIRGVN